MTPPPYNQARDCSKKCKISKTITQISKFLPIICWILFFWTSRGSNFRLRRRSRPKFRNPSKFCQNLFWTKKLVYSATSSYLFRKLFTYIAFFSGLGTKQYLSQLFVGFYQSYKLFWSYNRRNFRLSVVFFFFLNRRLWNLIRNFFKQ